MSPVKKTAAAAKKTAPSDAPAANRATIKKAAPGTKSQSDKRAAANRVTIKKATPVLPTSLV